MASRWSIFLPALCLYPIWITVGFREDLFQSIKTYYPMMIAMVLGSMIAGATPLGGGVVAFPVSVLVLGFTPSQGRDFSLLIQSVGMSAASFLIVYEKQHLLLGRGAMLGKMIFVSVIGMIVGFELLGNASPYVMNIVYTTTVVCLVLIFVYEEHVTEKLKLWSAKQRTRCNEDNLQLRGVIETVVIDGETARHDTMETTAIDDTAEDLFESQAIGEDDAFRESDRRFKSNRGVKTMFTLTNLSLPIFAIAGGLLSSQIGTGADVACYLHGKLLNAVGSRNNNHKRRAR